MWLLKDSKLTITRGPMNTYVCKSNFNILNTIKKTSRPKLTMSVGILHHKNHRVEQVKNGSNIKRRNIPIDNTVFIILKKFKGTLLTNKFDNRFSAADIYPIAF